MKISFVIDGFFQKNRIFDKDDLEANRDDCLRQYIELKNKLFNLGIEINTNDITPVEEADLVFFVNMPDMEDVFLKKAVLLSKPCYVFINELFLIHKSNASLEIHQYFKKIFTYQQDLIDNRRYFKTNYSFDFSKKYEQFEVKPFREKKFATLIAGNKTLDDQLELYSERIKTIRWFEANHPKKFDLYGNGWNVYNGRFHSLFGIKNYPSYKGTVSRKKETLSNYKFNICYENAKNVPGWITEKIFDSFFSGCIPVYWGWSGIESYVDKNCFINRMDFKDHEELYLFLSSMTENVYNGYIENIEAFLLRNRNDKNFEFGIDYFVETIVNQLITDFNIVHE